MASIPPVAEVLHKESGLKLRAQKTPPEFACRHPRFGDTTATLAFCEGATGRWHYVSNQHFVIQQAPSSLSELCMLALARKKLKPCKSAVDLERAADDSKLPVKARLAASHQLERVRADAARRETQMARVERARAEQSMVTKTRRPGELRAVTLAEVLAFVPDLSEHLAAAPDVWVSCTSCGKWRRLRHYGRCRVSSKWTCRDNVDPAFARCHVPQELDTEEIDRRLGLVGDEDEGYIPGGVELQFETVGVVLRGASGIRGLSSVPFWVACNRCAKWRRLNTRSARKPAHDEIWLCEMSPDLNRNSCAIEEEPWALSSSDASSWMPERSYLSKGKGGDVYNEQHTSGPLESLAVHQSDAHESLAPSLPERCGDGSSGICGSSRNGTWGALSLLTTGDVQQSLSREISRCSISAVKDLPASTESCAPGLRVSK